MKKICFLGCGNLVSSLVSGYFKKVIASEFEFYFYSPSQTRAKNLAEKYNQNFISEKKFIPKCDIYVFGFKPQAYLLARKEYSHILSKKSQIWSLLAGKSSKQISEDFPTQSIVRIMPNTCSQVSAGISLYTSKKVSDLESFKSFFEASSLIVSMKTDDLLDKVTGVSGSGAALIYEFLIGMQEKLISFGLERNHAIQVCSKLLYGSGLLLDHSGGVESLQSKITSKNGVTYAALESLRENSLKETISQSLDAAYKRSRELSSS